MDGLDSCVNCNAGLIAASNICPQCGWPKNKRIESDGKEIEDRVGKLEKNMDKLDEIEETIEGIKSNSSIGGTTELKNKVFRPTGVKLLGITHMVIGSLLVAFAFIGAAVVIFSVFSIAMSGVAGIGGGMMPMLPGMDGMDPTTMSSMIMINGMPDINGLSGAEFGITNSAGVMTVDEMMAILGTTMVMAIMVSILGLFIFAVGRGVLRGRGWARILIIISTIVSIPIAISFVGELDTLSILGSAAFDGLVLYYMTKPKVRDYFDQTSTKKPIEKSKIKTSQVVESPSPQVKQTTESVSAPNISPPSGIEGIDSSTQVRPTGVLILAILVIINGLIAIGVAAFAGTVLGSMGIVEGTSAMFGAGGAILGAITGVTAALGVASFVIAWGLLKGKSWAWTIALIWVIINLVMALPSTNVVGIIIDAILLYYLFRPHVKDYFGKSEQRL